MPNRERYDDADAEESEFSGGWQTLRGGAPYVAQAPVQNGNYQRIVIAWASFVTIVALGTIALIWSASTSQVQKNADAIATLTDRVTRIEERQKRQDDRMDFIQREVEQRSRAALRDSGN